MQRCIFTTAVFLTVCSLAYAEIALLPAVADTSISARDPDNNSGGHDKAFSGQDAQGNSRRALYRFDVSAVPAGSTIHSATLTLTLVQQPSGDVDSNFRLHSMTTNWFEGTKLGNNGEPATSGESTWNNRIHNTTPWSTSAGANGDFSASASASTFVAGSGSFNWSSAQLASDVQTWVDNPGLNFGWILISDDESTLRTAKGFGTRNHPTPANQPVLEIDYTPPAPSPQIPEGVLIESFAVTNETVEIGWTAESNLTYDVLFKRTLTDTNGWRAAETGIAAQPGSHSWTEVPLPASPQIESNTQMFYRVQSLTSSPPLEIGFDIVTNGLTAPLMATHAGDGSGRLFVVQQTGQIRIIDATDTLLPAPFLDVSSAMVSINPGYDERGLLGLAFHPDYAGNGRFFIHYSAPPNSGTHNNRTIIAEYSVSAGNSNLADSASAQILLQVEQPQSNHAGGTLTFGPDGYLYLGLGDGGGGGDNHGLYGNGQDPSNLLGAILRIDVDSGFPYAIPPDNPFVGLAGFAPEIFAYGFRNPYRFSFDRGGTNALFVGDVGQNLWEEIDIVSSGDNHGWRIAEGNFAYDLSVADALGIDVASLAYPIHNYDHSHGISVIGGYVYRGSQYPELVGKYVFGDYNQKLYYLEETTPGIWQRFGFSIQPGGGPLDRYVKGFGEDEDGEIYLMTDSNQGPSGTGGDVRRLIKP